MDAPGRAVGLLAGEGRLPEVLAQAIRARGRTLICIQVAGESPALGALAAVYARLDPGEWQRVFGLWREHGVREVVFAGTFQRAALPADLATGDSTARTFLSQIPDRRDQSFLDGVAGLLEGLGMRVVDQLAYIKDLVPAPGLLAGRPPSAGEQRDVELGITVARTLAAQDVGQTVVLRDGVILAVEAAEGTDAAIRRGGEMAPGTVVVKVSRPQQDPRFDVPTIGPETIETMAAVGARLLALEAGRTIVLDRPRLAAAAEATAITVLAVDAPPLGRSTHGS